MKTSLVTAPAAEPVSLADAKLHLRIETAYTADDTYITALLSLAREYVELVTNRKLITQTWKYYPEDWPCRDYIDVPHGKLQSVTSVVYYDSDGTATTMPSSDYIVESATDPGRIVLAYGESWPSATLYPSNPIHIQFVCGYGLAGSTVPTPIIQAIKIMVSDMYEQRESAIVGRSVTMTKVIDNLLFPYRLWNFG
jgi:uncharacterized phiE125 gp8 family phage protein